jgi:hypothetical protein
VHKSKAARPKKSLHLDVCHFQSPPCAHCGPITDRAACTWWPSHSRSQRKSSTHMSRLIHITRNVMRLALALGVAMLFSVCLRCGRNNVHSHLRSVSRLVRTHDNLHVIPRLCTFPRNLADAFWAVPSRIWLSCAFHSVWICTRATGS